MKCSLHGFIFRRRRCSNLWLGCVGISPTSLCIYWHFVRTWQPHPIMSQSHSDGFVKVASPGLTCHHILFIIWSNAKKPSRKGRESLQQFCKDTYDDVNGNGTHCGHSLSFWRPNDRALFFHFPALLLLPRVSHQPELTWGQFITLQGWRGRIRKQLDWSL